MVDFVEDIKKCMTVLKQGGTILYPTDTVWGLGCDALNEAAVEKIFDLKKRPREKSLIILLAEAKDIFEYIAAPPPDIIAILESFEKPTTVVYNGPLGFPGNIINNDGSLAIRITKDPFCIALIKRFGKPVVSTSANISGHPTPAVYRMIDEEVKSGVDYIVTYRQDDEIKRSPSQLVKLDDLGNIEILRG